MTTIGIAGGTGYTAGELLRLLLRHPMAEVRFVHSASHAGTAVSSVHTNLAGDTNLVFTNTTENVNVLFLCLGHGVSADFLTKNKVNDSTKIIDLGNDFRTTPNFGGRTFVYGLPELCRNSIRKTNSVANPGCFATAVELALLPLAAQNLLHHEVHVSAITGSSGAGRTLSDTTHFSWRANNVSVYKPFRHQHLLEMRQTLLQCGNSSDFELCFVPMRGNFVRGIFAAIYTNCTLSEDEVNSLYSRFYSDEPFVHVVQHALSLRDVVGTNKCMLEVRKIDGRIFITTALDNLVKGASGQAIQNMNLMCGMDENFGL